MVLSLLALAYFQCHSGAKFDDLGLLLVSLVLSLMALAYFQCHNHAKSKLFFSVSSPVSSISHCTGITYMNKTQILFNFCFVFLIIKKKR